MTDALAAGQPVVALESTIIAHGLPYPENLETAQLLEQTIRDKGAVPATIAVLEGMATAGLSAAELAHICNPETEILKLSRRDLPFALSQKRTGATTVATTMMIAAQLVSVSLRQAVLVVYIAALRWILISQPICQNWDDVMLL